MKGRNVKKICAWICAVVLMISGITYSTDNAVSAQSYDELTYVTLDSSLSYSIVSNSVEGWTNPWYGDGGITFQFIFAGEPTNMISATKIKVNGVEQTVGGGVVTEIAQGCAKVNPKNFEDNAYTQVELTTTSGTAVVVFKKGTPSSSGQVPTGGGQTPVTPSEGQTTAGGQTPSVEPVTTTPPAATALPKKVQGLLADSKVGDNAVSNAIFVAWADASNPNNKDIYDASIISHNVYVYGSNGQLVTKITKGVSGNVIGGFSAGTYQVSVAAVNSMGEGPMSEKQSVTVTGETLNYNYPANCIGPKAPTGLTIITANPEVKPSVGNETNAIEVAWAASSTVESSAYDNSVVGYNIYLFDKAEGKPYRRVYVQGISENYTAIKTVSAGTYLVYLSAVDANGNESALSAPGIGMPSTVTVTGEKYDNAQSFDYPNQPTLPVGLEILTQGIQYGFTVAWAADAKLSGIKLNLYANGVCIKSGINQGESSYYENRLAAGTYTIEVKAQYTSNNVESFAFRKDNVTIASDPGLDTKSPQELADPTYKPYEGQETPTTPPVDPTKPTENPTDKPVVTPTENPTDKPIVTPTDPTKPTENPTDKPVITPTKNPVTEPTTQKVQPTKKPPVTTVAPTKKVKVGKTAVKSAIKKKKAKKAKISLKKIKGVTGYQVSVSTSKKFKKNVKTKKYKKTKITFKKLKAKKKYYVKARAYKVIKGTVYYGDWTKPKKIKMK